MTPFSQPAGRPTNASTPLQFGAQLWSQGVDWTSFRDAALAAESAGWDNLWTWDHLHAIFGPWEQPIFEGWLALAAVSGITDRIGLGLMVGANTLRNPGLTAKLAITLDHASGGRATLGIGGAWFEREHDAFGIDFGSSIGERLDRLDESVMLIRRLLDGERFSHEGRFYTFHDALSAPPPVQAHLPILVGGSGPRKTLRTVAKYADVWNTSGSFDDVRQHVANLERHCADVGRDASQIVRSISFPIVLRDSRADAESAFAVLAAHNGTLAAGNVPHLLGPPADVADTIRPYVTELGFRHVGVRMPAPYDRETIARVSELRDLLA